MSTGTPQWWRLAAYGLLGLPLAFAALFAVPGGLTGAPAAAWVAVVFVAGNLLFAAYQVPYLATPADLADLARYGARCFLIGESLMRQADVTAATRAILAKPLTAQGGA